MTEKDLIFYMGGDIHYQNKVIANLQIDCLPLKYILLIDKQKIICESREQAVDEIIQYLES